MSGAAADSGAMRPSVVTCAQTLAINFVGASGRRQLRADLENLAAAVRADSFILLLMCLLVDAIGVASFLLLIFGEMTDVFWAPMCGFFLQYMFGSVLITSLGCLEEFLPFTDIIPTATLAWAIANVESLSWLRTLLGVHRGGLSRAPVDHERRTQ
ncbi:unnamed protein product [Polarella glacialis]|uniref:Uncharacterized protein n=1 Tax=Polarella glacialis TaxID=89957 RepID=A0A813EFR1_POLGL|nr:unnamed protein product [Polarella glacialis]